MKELKEIKPKKPIEPIWAHYTKPTIPNDVNYKGEPLFIKLDWIKDKKQYNKDLEQYEKDLAVWEQTKFIRLIKKRPEKYVLKHFKITKIK